VIRAVIAAATAIVLGGAAVGTGAALHDTGAALGRVVADGVVGVSVADAPGHAAIVHVPANSAMLAVSAGTVTVVSPGQVTLYGTGDDTGLEVDYAGLDDTTTAAIVQRGQGVGHVLDASHAVTMHVLLDGKPLDTASLLRSALEGARASAGTWSRPVDGAVVSQLFGCSPYAMEPVDRSCPSGHIHTGIDLAVAMGTPVHAVLDGVAHVVDSVGGYGLHVIVESGDGLSTLYAHLQSVEVHDGDEVVSGDVIGDAGSSGNSTGPHLHFEVRRDGIPEDPALDMELP
jgi:hypothetical protein